MNRDEIEKFESVVMALVEAGAISREVAGFAVDAARNHFNGPTDELLSRNEAARYLKCSAKTVDRLCEDGKLTKIHTSKRGVRIRLAEIQAMLGI